jgi:RNA polymerase-binding transcription factor DksA
VSGYTGNPDAEAEHALILSENGINASRSMVEGPVLTECLDCGDEIAPARVEAMKKINMRCMYCITCQPMHDRAGGIKMLDRIL